MFECFSSLPFQFCHQFVGLVFSFFWDFPILLHTTCVRSWCAQTVWKERKWTQNMMIKKKRPGHFKSKKQNQCSLARYEDPWDRNDSTREIVPGLWSYKTKQHTLIFENTPPRSIYLGSSCDSPQYISVFLEVLWCSVSPLSLCIDWFWLLIFRTNLVRGPWNKKMKFQNKGAVLVQIAPLFI